MTNRIYRMDRSSKYCYMTYRLDMTSMRNMTDRLYWLHWLYRMDMTSKHRNMTNRVHWMDRCSRCR